MRGHFDLAMDRQSYGARTSEGLITMAKHGYIRKTPSETPRNSTSPIYQVETGSGVKKKPCVLFLTSSYPRHDEDSASIFLRYLARSIAQAGSAVHVLAPDDKEVIPGQITDQGVTLHRFRYLPRRLQRLAYGSGILPNLRRHPLLYLQIPFFLGSMAIALWRICRVIRPDIIHAHWIIPQGIIAVYVGRVLKIPVVTTAHGGDAFALKAAWLSSVKRWVIKRSSAWTANTSTTSLAAGVDSSVPSPVLIPMGVDIELFQSGDPRALRQRHGHYKYIVLFVGRLVEKKGVKDLIEALALLPASLRQAIGLWIVGDGADRKPLETLTRARGLESRVIFWGTISNRQLPDFYAAADLFVAPSTVDAGGDTEGQGVVFLEAMASGTPIIATTAGGIPEVLTPNHTAVLIRPSRPRELARAIENLLSDSWFRDALSRAAVHTVIERYSWEFIASKFQTIYRQAEAAHRQKRQSRLSW